MPNDTVLRLRLDGHLWKRIIGLPFFAFGLLALWAITQADDPGTLLWIIFPLLGTLFSAVSGFILFSRFETEIDRAAGSVTDMTKLFAFISRKRRDIGHSTRVVLRAEERTNTSADDFDSRTYWVWLRGPGESDAGIRLISESKYTAARAHAVATAEYLALPLEDHISDEPRGDGSRPVPPARKPPSARFAREDGSGFPTLRLAAPGLRGIHLFYLIVAFAFPLGVHFLLRPAALPDWDDPGAGIPYLMVYGLFAATPGLVLATPALRSLTESLCVRFETARLTIRRHWLFGWSNRSIPRSEIAKVDLAASSRSCREPGLHGSVVRVIVRDGGVVELGTMLTRKEAAWLRDEIHRNAGG